MIISDYQSLLSIIKLNFHLNILQYFCPYYFSQKYFVLFYHFLGHPTRDRIVQNGIYQLINNQFLPYMNGNINKKL